MGKRCPDAVRQRGGRIAVRDPLRRAREAAPGHALEGCLHELAYHIRCTDGTELHMTLLAAIGDPGQFERSCDGATVVVGPATPANSPPGGGRRIISDRTCIDQFVLVPPGQRSNFGVLHESWQLSLSLRRA